jgi:3',5'-cyclic-AMP phosphodiesterase
MPIYLPPISRRRFLAGSLAVGASALLGQQVAGAQRRADPNRWVLISDTHIGANRKDKHNGVFPAATFAETVEQVLALDPRPAGVIISGDQAFLKGLPENYTLIRELFQPIREAGVPLHLVLGNHDHRDNFWAAFPECKPAKAAAHRQAMIVETPLANWFLMDSLHETGLTPGLLGKDQLYWLAQSLEDHPTKPALLVAHHNLDGITGLGDAAALLQIAANHPQAKAYFYGHTHQWKVHAQMGIHLVNVPATGWLFDAKEPRGWLDLTLQKTGAAVVLNALDKKHAKHGERHALKWRA